MWFGLFPEDNVRVVANHDRSLIQTPVAMKEPPTLKGYLNKYTNVAKGYSTRWFVLANGVLSCSSCSHSFIHVHSLTRATDYRHQDDESITSRGSISMKNAFLKTSSGYNHQHLTPNSIPSNKSSLRFEIHSLPSAHASSSSSQQQKWYIKANHPTEAARWITAIQTCMDWYTKRDNNGTHTGGNATPNLIGAGAGVGAELGMARRFSGESYSDSKSVYSSVKSNKPQVVSRPSMAPTGLSISVSGTGAGGGDTDSINIVSAVDPNVLSDFGAFLGVSSSGGVERGDEEDEEDVETSSADTGARGSGQGQVPPYEAECEIATNSVVMQLEAIQQLIVSYLGSTTTELGTGSSRSVATPAPPASSIAPGHLSQPSAMESSVSSSGSIQSSSGISTSLPKTPSHKSANLVPPPSATIPSSICPLSTSTAVPTVTSVASHPHESLILTSLDQLSSLLDTHLNIVSTREGWYKKKLKSERRRQCIWEESLKTVVREGEMLENELRERRRRRGSVSVSGGKIEGVGIAGDGRKRKETIKAVGRSAEVSDEVGFLGGSEDVGRAVDSCAPQDGSFALRQTKREGTTDTIATVSQPEPKPYSQIRSQTQVRFGAVEQMIEEEEEYDDSEDEFFDAIESNNLPGLVIPPPLSKPLSSPTRLPPYISEEPYSGM